MQIYTKNPFDQRLVSNCVISELETRHCKCSAVSNPPAQAGAAVENLIQHTFRWH